MLKRHVKYRYDWEHCLIIRKILNDEDLILFKSHYFLI